MDDKMKNTITSRSLDRLEIRKSLLLWQYCPIMSSICKSFDDDTIKRDTLLILILEEIAYEAWKNGIRHEQECSYNESLNESDTENT